jgi:hypothetical protein
MRANLKPCCVRLFQKIGNARRFRATSLPVQSTTRLHPPAKCKIVLMHPILFIDVGMTRNARDRRAIRISKSKTAENQALIKGERHLYNNEQDLLGAFLCRVFED